MNKSKKIKTASILGIIGNLFLSIIKGIIGYTTNSRAMIADTFNSAADIFTSLMTFIGNKIASKPRDDDHNLGHGKAEYIYSMIISITMIFMSLTILKDSIMSLINKNTYEYSIYLVYICIITIEPDSSNFCSFIIIEKYMVSATKQPYRFSRISVT